MNRSLLLSAFGLGLVVFACTGATEDDGSTNASEDDLTLSTSACDGKECGDTCTLCPPGKKNCFETAVLKQCNAEGRCSATVAECAIDAGPAPKPYEPCGDKACGDTCTICDPTDPNCFETAVLKVCSADGKCGPTIPVCDVDGGPAPYIPCAGKKCGDSCTICDPTDTDCFETAVLKTCDPNGACTPSFSTCE